MRATIAAVEYHLPETTLTNEELASEFQDWTPEKILDKTGIRKRHIASAKECASDLAFAAARALFGGCAIRPNEIEYLIFCTQAPDYMLPTSACLLQDRLGLSTSCGAVDINLGCSGYVYGLGLAKGLIESGQVRSVLLLTADTYSKFINKGDKSVRTLFGDGGAATVIRAADGNVDAGIGAIVYGTDGSGANHLIVPTSGMRTRPSKESGIERLDAAGSVRSEDNLFMNGAEVFGFTMRTVPPLVSKIMAKAGRCLDDYDYVVCHQANKFMLDHLRKRMAIPSPKFVLDMEMSGNTVSSTIPIALTRLMRSGELKRGQRVLLVGFGVGLSWAAAEVVM